MHLGVQRQGLGAGTGAGRIAGGVQRLHRGQQAGLVAPVAQDLPALAQDAHPLRQRGLVVQRGLPVGLGVGVGIQRQRRFGRGQAVGHGAGRLAAGFPVAGDVGAVLAGRLQHPAHRLGLALHPGDHGVAHAVGHRQFGIVLRGIVERRLPGAIRPQAQQARAAPLAQRLAQEERVAAGGAFQPLGEAARVAGARQPIDQCRDAVAIQRCQAQLAGAGGLLQRLLPGCGLGRRPFGPLHPDLTDRPGCAAGLRGGRRGHRRAGHAQAGADACGQLLGLGAGCQAQLAHQGVAAARVLGHCGAAVARGGVQAHGLAVQLFLQRVVGQQLLHRVQRPRQVAGRFGRCGLGRQQLAPAAGQALALMGQPVVEGLGGAGLQAIGQRAPPQGQRLGGPAAIGQRGKGQRVALHGRRKSQHLALAAQRIAGAGIAQAGQLTAQVAAAGAVVGQRPQPAGQACPVAKAAQRQQQQGLRLVRGQRQELVVLQQADRPQHAERQHAAMMPARRAGDPAAGPGPAVRLARRAGPTAPSPALPRCSSGR